MFELTLNKDAAQTSCGLLITPKENSVENVFFIFHHASFWNHFLSSETNFTTSEFFWPVIF